MEYKCIKKSTLLQLQSLVAYMEDNPQFAQGTPVYGTSKMSTKEQWKKLTLKLNSYGPPVRSVSEWKKTWADLKSRTKKKIAENRKSLQTGGGLYRAQPLTELEQIIETTCFLSTAGAPKGSIFGIQPNAEDSYEDSCQSISDSPPRGSKSIAVITPTRHQKQRIQQNILQRTQEETEQTTSEHMEWNITDSTQEQPQQPCNNPPFKRSQTQPTIQQRTSLYKQRKYYMIDDEQPGCSSAKKHEIRLKEENFNAFAREQANAVKILAGAAKRMADAVDIQAEAAKRSADAADIQADAAKRSADAAVALTGILQSYMELLKDLKKNK